MKKIPLSQGLFALVDDSDYEYLMQWKWCASKCAQGNYYASGSKNGKRSKMHKLLTGFALTDHKDGNGLNNQRENLREATQAQNLMNRGKQKNNTSGYKGVCWDKQSGKWKASIQKEGRARTVGAFHDKIKAARAYDKAALKLHGEFAKLNFPEIS